MKTRAQIEINCEAIEGEVINIISEAIYAKRGVRVPVDVLLFNSKTRLLSHSLEVRENRGVISTYSHHETAKLTYRGLPIMLQLPPIRSEGRQLDLYITDLQSLVDYASIASVALPFDPLNEKLGVRFVSRTSACVYSSDHHARFTDPKRIVSCVNDLMRYLNLEPLSQLDSNPMLARIESAIANQGYHCEFIANDVVISEVYYNESNFTNEFKSCMAGKSSAWFEIYDDLESHDRLTMVRLVNGSGEFKGRALCWKGNNPNDLYLDRLYVPESNGVQVGDALDAFRKFCAENNIRKTTFDKTAKSLGLEFKAISIEVPQRLGFYDYFPYADSMDRFCSDGKLRNHSNYPSGVCKVAELCCTNGSFNGDADDQDDENTVLLHDGTHCHIDDACYVERYGEYYSYDVCVCAISGDYEVSDDCEELDSSHYGRDTWAHHDDVTTTYDGEFILISDAIELHDATYAHADEVRELEDGTNRNALRDDCDELSDGRWVLSADVATLEALIAEMTSPYAEPDENSDTLPNPPTAATVEG